MMVRDAPWVPLALTALGLAATAQGCALIAGLQQHTLDTGTGGATSASSGSTGGSVSASSTGGAGGGGGAGPITPGWPDSSTAYCTDGVAKVPCPTADMAKLHGQDGDVRINVPVYQTTPKVVTDLRTGLTWRRAPLSPKTQKEALDFCATQSFEGSTDWRLPSRRELVSLVDYGAVGAHIDQVAFPEVMAAPLWSSTHLATGPATMVWGVDLGCSLACPMNMGASGSTIGMYDGNAHPALCVRGAPLASGDFGPAVDGTTTDKTTGLVWTVDTSNGISWGEAFKYCRDTLSHDGFGTFSDWRVPSIKELQTIVDDTAKSGAGYYAPLHVPMSGGEYLWSSTPTTDVATPILIYTLLTGGDAVTLTLADTYGHTRCVRGP